MTPPRRPRPGPGSPTAPTTGPPSAPPSPPPGDPAATSDPDRPLPGALLVLGVVALVVVAVIGALVSVLLTPFRIGTVLLPVAVVVAVVVNVVLARLGFAMSRSRGVAAVPVVVFFLAAWAPTVVATGDVLLPGGTAWQTAIGFGTLLLGVFAGVVTVVRSR